VWVVDALLTIYARTRQHRIPAYIGPRINALVGASNQGALRHETLMSMRSAGSCFRLPQVTMTSSRDRPPNSHESIPTVDTDEIKRCILQWVRRLLV
jgi:hypothetical protein